MQRPSKLARRALLIQLICLRERFRIDRDERVQHAVIRGNPNQVLRNQFTRSNALALQRGLYSGMVASTTLNGCRFALPLGDNQRQ